jgi:hypothetical protein
LGVDGLSLISLKNSASMGEKSFTGDMMDR